MKYFLAVFSILLSLSVFGQGWELTFGEVNNHEGHSVQQTLDGGYIITGNTSYFGIKNGDVDVYLIKTNGIGEEQWSQTFGGTNHDEGRAVQQTSDGGYIITGYTASFGNGGNDVYLIKTNGNGEEQWSQTIGGANHDEGYSVQQTSDGGYIISGKTFSFGNGGNDVYLIKTNGNGEELWSQTFGGISHETGYSVQQTADGGYIIAGRTSSFGNGVVDVYLVKTNGNGEEQWSQSFGGTGQEWGWSVQQTSDGGYIITGVRFFGNGSGLSSVVILIKTNGNGEEQWSQTFGGANTDSGRCVQQTSDGGYIIAGSTSSFGNGSGDVYLIKTYGNGEEQWSHTFGGTNYDSGHSVQQTSDGGYIITGYSGFGNGRHDLYLIKTGSEGTLSSSFTIPTTSSNRKLVKVIDALGREANQAKNQILFHLYDDGSVEKKFVVE